MTMTYRLKRRITAMDKAYSKMMFILPVIVIQNISEEPLRRKGVTIRNIKAVLEMENGGLTVRIYADKNRITV